MKDSFIRSNLQNPVLVDDCSGIAIAERHGPNELQNDAGSSKQRRRMPLVERAIVLDREQRD